VNVFVRFGQWLEERRVLRWPDYRDLRQKIDECALKSEAAQIINTVIQKAKKDADDFLGIANRLSEHINVLEAEKQVPSTASKEINMLKIRLERIELLVGLKREPVITNLPEAPRIS